MGRQNSKWHGSHKMQMAQENDYDLS